MNPLPTSGSRISPVAAALSIVGALLMAGCIGFAAESSEIHKRFEIPPGGSLVVEVDRGAIEVKAADQDFVEVQVSRQVKGASGDKAQKILDEHVVDITQEQNTVKVTALGPKQKGRFFGFGNSPQIQARFHITVPKKFDARLKTAGGSIRVTDLEGDLAARTSGGSLNFSHITGPVRGDTSGGNVSLTGATGPVELQTSGGGIDVTGVQGSVKASTSGGSIRVREASGDLTLRTSGGNISVDGAKGNLAADTSGGSVNASFASSPSPSTKCSLQTSGGSIEVRLPADAGINVDAKTSGGRVSTDLPLTLAGEQKRNHLRGKLNGGGAALELRTSGGNIRLSKS